MSIQKYKVTFWKQLKFAWMAVLGLLVFPIIPIYDIIVLRENNFLASIVIFGILLIIYVPFFILHAKYYSLNKYTMMLYSSEIPRLTITDRKLKTETAFTLDDIKYVFHTKSGSGLMPWSSYYFTEIYLKDGKKFIITCLLASNFKLPVGEKYESTTVNYPYPKGF